MTVKSYLELDKFAGERNSVRALVLQCKVHKCKPETRFACKQISGGKKHGRTI